MKFNSKTEARKYLEDKNIKLLSVTDEELIAIKEFFTDEELADISFTKFNVEDCFKNPQTDN